MFDLFGNQIDPAKATRVNIYADEIWETLNIHTGEKWIYSAAIYEKVDSPILEDLVHSRFRKDKENWKDKERQNDTDLHWVELNSLDKKFVLERWLKYMAEDCIRNRKFYFSLTGINISNLNLNEFDSRQKLNSIYNRFFRSMLLYSLKKFFGNGVVVDNIFHEQGSQEHHRYFDWHTIFKLDQDEDLNFNCSRITFLPKSHRDDVRSNILQFCDALAGIFKDLHLGVSESRENEYRRQILGSRIVKDLLIDRVIRKPRNVNSSYGYANRFHLSFFPKFRSDPGSIFRSMDNYYDIAKIELAFEYNPNQARLF